MPAREIRDPGIRRVLEHMGHDLRPRQWGVMFNKTSRDISKTLRAVHWERVGVRQHAVMMHIGRRAAYAPDIADALNMPYNTVHEVLSTLRRRNIVATNEVQGQRANLYSLTSFGRSLLTMG